MTGILNRVKMNVQVLKGEIVMCWYVAKKTGKVLSSKELNDGYKYIRQKSPGLTADEYRDRLTRTILLEPIEEIMVVDVLVLANRLDEAAKECENRHGWTAAQAKNVITMMACDMGVL